MEPLLLAQAAYSAYGNWLGWKNSQGQSLLTWDQLSTSHKNAWTVAIETTAVQLRQEAVVPVQLERPLK